MANNWIVRFEMAEDFRHKQLVGEVPPAALQWLSSHWELLPRDGWVTRGSLRGGDNQTAWLSEEEQLFLTHESGEKQLLPQTVTREEEVSL